MSNYPKYKPKEKLCQELEENFASCLLNGRDPIKCQSHLDAFANCVQNEVEVFSKHILVERID